MSETKTQTKTSARKRRADAERSIEAIVNGALDALANDPDASMAEIARRAGVARATIYMHFPTRETLLDAVMENATTQVAERYRIIFRCWSDENSVFAYINDGIYKKVWATGEPFY